jgi:non-heme chloroperoxidase
MASAPRSRFAENGGVSVHYLDSVGEDRIGPPVVFVPGMGDEASEYRELLDALLPRRALAVDLRGRGLSDVPEGGYALSDHVGDLDAAIGDAEVDSVHLVSYSRGTSYALGWAIAHPDRVVSIVIGDYPALQIVVPEEHREAFCARRWRGRAMSERMSRSAIAATFAEAVATEFWEGLAALRCPVLLIRGGARGAIVDDAVEARYRATVPDLEVVCFEESGHDLWSPDPNRFGRTVGAFVDSVDTPTGGVSSPRSPG